MGERGGGLFKNGATAPPTGLLERNSMVEAELSQLALSLPLFYPSSPPPPPSRTETLRECSSYFPQRAKASPHGGFCTFGFFCLLIFFNSNLSVNHLLTKRLHCLFHCLCFGSVSETLEIGWGGGGGSNCGYGFDFLLWLNSYGWELCRECSAL